MKRWLSYLSQLLFAITLLVGFSSVVSADEITSFEFMDKANTSFIIGANSYVNGNFSVVVEDTTQAKPYINLLIATTGYPDFVITENDYFANTVIKKLYSSGTININGYTADLYVVQFATRGTNWNCSSSGLNCYVSTELRLNNTYSYNSMYQLQSIALTDSVLTDDYLANMQINQNNQIIEQGKETNEKLDNLDETIQSGNQAIQDSITESNKETQEVIKDQFNSCRDSLNLFDFDVFKSTNNIYSLTGTVDNFTIKTNDVLVYYIFGKEATQYTISGFYSTSYGNGAVNITYSDGTSQNIFSKWDNGSLSDTKFLVTTSADKTVLNIRFITYGANANWTIKNFMIQEGTLATEYENPEEKVCSNKLDEQNETSKGIWATIKDLPNQFLEMLKGLFIPDEEELQSLIDEFKSTMEKKLGAIYQVGDLIVSVFDSILDPPEENSCITFPEIKDPMFDKLLIEETDYCFDSLRTDFDFLFNLSDMIICIICTLSFANMLYRKFEAFIGGVTSDY